MTDRTPTPAPPELSAADRNDTIITKALIASLVIVLVTGSLVGGMVFFLTREAEEAPVEEASLVLPRVQQRDATPPSVVFRDVTAESGIDFVHANGARGKKLLPETMGPGCAFADFDTDGDPDLLLVNGKPWPGEEAEGEPLPTLAYYRNDGEGRFENATAAVGLDVSLYGMGAAAGDIDSDGDPDLFVTAVGENRLFRNDGSRFVDVTATAGVGGDPATWSTSAGLFDADNDGDLDLFVCNYVLWSPEIDLALDYRLVGVGRAYGPPTNFAGVQPYFYRNRGDGTFREEAEAAGFHVTNDATGEPVAKALALSPIDVDRDGWIDLFVANDTVRNFLYRNTGDGNFEERGIEAGVAYDSDGNSTGAMGVDAAFYRNDATLGLGVGNFATEMSSFYVSADASLLFNDESIIEGIGPVSRRMLSFGLFFFDYDLDGRLDLFQTNGHLEEEINRVQPSQHYAQPSQLFWNSGPRYPSSFTPVPEVLTGDLGRAVVGRAAAYGDIDADGDLDILITQAGEPPLLLRNDQRTGHHWIRFRLSGKRANREGIGAWVEVDAGGTTQRQQVMPTRSYLAQVPPEVTFGLGSNRRVDAVRIFWPGTEEPQAIGELDADRVHVIEEE